MSGSLQRAQIELDPDLALITGCNANGRTSVLEAIHILATRRSFRTATTDQVQRYGSNELVNLASCQTQNQSLASANQVAYFGGPEQRRLGLNGDTAARISEIANLIPIVTISPDTHYDFKAGGRSRRGAREPEVGFCFTWNTIFMIYGNDINGYSCNEMRP